MPLPRTARAGAPRVVTVGEASEILHVHPNTLRKWSDRGLIPSYRIGQRRDRRFVLKHLLDFLERDGDQRLDRSSPSPPDSVYHRDTENWHISFSSGGSTIKPWGWSVADAAPGRS